MIISSHFAPARLPINQKVIVFNFCESSDIYTKKLENELHTELNAIPDKRSFIELLRPPIFDITKTKIDIVKAPIKPINPIELLPKILPNPRITERVAPRDAPDDTPSI